MIFLIRIIVADLDNTEWNVIFSYKTDCIRVTLRIQQEYSTIALHLIEKILHW